MTPTTAPDEAQAYAFASMLNAGATAADAILYFLDGDEEAAVVNELIWRWSNSRRVRKAMLKILGKSFFEMDQDTQIHTSLSLHYRQLATFLFTHHYAELNSTDKAKADTARTALEAKVAGTAGKTDPLSRFFDDLNSGKLKLAKPGLVAGAH